MSIIQISEAIKEEFLAKKPIVPCSMIIKDDGKIDICYDGFEKIPLDKIKFVEEKESCVVDIENNEDYCLYNGQIFSSDILLLSTKDIFKFNSKKKLKVKTKNIHF